MEPAKTKHEHEVDELLEEFDEKVKLHADDVPDEFQNKDKDNEKMISTPIHTEEMDHIFNQFNEETNSSNTHVRRPSLSNNDLHIVTDIPQQEIPFDFNRFLEQMRSRNSKPITRYFKSFLQAFDRRPWTANEQIKIIQDFLDFIFIKMRECDVWKDMSEQEFGNAKEGMEKLVMNRLYHVTFCPNTTDDKERDEILHQKISIFRWIREKHLDIPETEHNESFLSFAESEILKINNYKAPRDKLICILNCCKVIFGLIKHVEGDAGADKFLPILIYVVIRANPPRLVSNVQYIYRFRNPEQLQAESGYYLTNLMGAISFIETMEANSLSITKEEFDLNIERTMSELQQERPSIMLDKQQINYENAVHPSRIQSQPLLDPAKASALLERGSLFAQKTMQRPLSFVGKIFQGLSDTSGTSSRAESPVEEHQETPLLPPRPMMPDQQLMMMQRQQFDSNLETLSNMFTNVDISVCKLILNTNHGDLAKSVDHLLDISGTQDTNAAIHNALFLQASIPTTVPNDTR
ncbi:uncharacterized protein EV154DRAFT_139235 [Mucor mucedo]|uniref:uncharacterized protein n=1 Tax=Mucor mucedo TaxID=29922 RepID=UPI00221F17DC|nr:uncharacterized protein EV154DRAFT_139235 [Mucor mucedo]KAI7893675.1 hypothetical protein EV154DRAFT_139235 [Mucor mucedo]